VFGVIACGITTQCGTLTNPITRTTQSIKDINAVHIAPVLAASVNSRGMENQGEGSSD